MKIKFVLGLIFLFLIGCSSTKNKKSIVLTDGKIKLGEILTTNNWNSLIYTDAKGNKVELPRIMSASGMQFSNKDINIHFKGDEGILEQNKKNVHFFMKER